MKQYQVVIYRMQSKVREDEDGLTDLLNERARSGWLLERTTSLSQTRVMLIFVRQA